LKNILITPISGKLRYWINDIYKLGYYHILTVNTLSTLFGFASQLFVAWILTVEEIGQIRIMQSFLSYAVLIGGLGFNSSTLKLCSEKRPVGEALYLYKKSLVYAGILSIATLIGFVILNFFGLLIKNKSFENPLSILLLSVFPLVINGIDASYLQSLREFKQLSRIQLISRIISIILIISLTYLKGLYGFIIANVIGNFTASFLLFSVVNKINIGVKPIKLNNPFDLHLKYSVFAFLSNITFQLSVFLDMILLNYLVKDDLKGIGSYGFATIVISFFLIITYSFQQVLVPVFSNSSSNLSEWRGLFKKYSRVYFISISIIEVVGLVSLPFMLELVFGTKFQKIGPFFLLLWLAWYMKSLFSIHSSALFSLGRLKVIFISSLLMVVIGLPLNYFMINKYGVIGAGMANVITSLAGLIIYYYAFSSVVKKLI
jgi:O-antigen/teichoic acid export membrane protein